MLQFLYGASVKTNERYYNRHGRVVEGLTVEPNVEIGEGNMIVRWISQSGKVDERLDGQMVIMSELDLEFR